MMLSLPIGYPFGAARAWQRRQELPPVATRPHRLLLLGKIGCGLRQGALQAVLLKAQQERHPTLLLRQAGQAQFSVAETLLYDYGLPTEAEELSQAEPTPEAWLHVRMVAPEACVDVAELYRWMKAAGYELLVVEGFPSFIGLAFEEAALDDQPCQLVIALEQKRFPLGLEQKLDALFKEQLIYLEGDETCHNLPQQVDLPTHIESRRGVVYYCEPQATRWLHNPPMLPPRKTDSVYSQITP